ncbi:(d)CMP kinase [Brevibacillus sp. 7WMA2]|uniref:Cytidylate kinase n=1 Tax=Brevibacillus laterosporus LMG 15441 TaxID=1042163 RepID=A0A075R2T6_BRELA|nr:MULTISPECIES: (d)CMP kinase [Brevibacillus]AIG26194.1 cytidylate kinase [Brevibacillus laterosporus LMG 15441]AUM64776.1 (d)CMP kinase [Brevibacillus laterosporus]MBA4534083.1 (d)CMP kinase [Brevibacillus halotolerans]MCR8964457.1 (d)CMP kinase [Brevibacillus laterosporus]MCR8995276.1 (d)CMP kinase [Brevibacillus laterosporus]
MNIAIDGPAGAGKSTVAQLVAAALQYVYIDTGAMYRALAWAVLKNGTAIEDQESVASLLQQAKIELKRTEEGQRVYWDHEDITHQIRTQEVSNYASVVASYPAVRATMLILQREMAQQGNVVMDGRDIGTHVLPEAEVKIFLTASIEERATRRFGDLLAKGEQPDINELQKEIAERDKRDRERETAPLKQADDAILLDTTGMPLDEVVNKILALCK